MRLSDCFTELLAYTSYFYASVEKEQLSFERVKDDIYNLINKSEKLHQKGGFGQHDYETARFAVFAFIDEKIQNSSWNERSSWQRESLQIKYYKTSKFGIEFYDSLNTLSPNQKDIREVYYLCLALGFQGRYNKIENKIQFENIKGNVLELLSKNLDKLLETDNIILIPEAYDDKSENKYSDSIWKRIFSRPALWWFFMPCLLYTIVFLFFYFILNSEISLTS